MRWVITTPYRRLGLLSHALSECDTPLELVDHTFDWLHKNWVNDVDFVVWTGDNARHDIDSSLPRSLTEIYKLNVGLSERMIKLFESRGIPVVPSLGNNDIYRGSALGEIYQAQLSPLRSTQYYSAVTARCPRASLTYRTRRKAVRIASQISSRSECEPSSDCYSVLMYDFQNMGRVRPARRVPHSRERRILWSRSHPRLDCRVAQHDVFL